MTLVESIILGIIQGLTEFLPVSSSGHLVLMEKIFGISNNIILFNIFVHVGTLVAVCVIFFKQIKEVILHPFGDLSKKLIFSMIPTLIIVLCFMSFIESTFSNNFFIIGFFITAALLFITDILSKKRINTPHSLNMRDVFIMGIAQGLATVPGVSRSGSTICAGLINGNNREEVANFSFLMSAPIIIASMLYELLKLFKIKQISSIEITPLLLGFLFAFIFGLISLKLMLNIVKKQRLVWFSLYLVILGTVCCFIFI